MDNQSQSINSSVTVMVSPDPLTVGIDPGMGGGFAWSQGGAVHTAAMPKTEGDVRDFLHNLLLSSVDTTVYIEEIPKFIAGAASSSAIAKLHGNYGFLKGFLMARGVRMHTVIPHTWQKPLGVGTKSGKSTTVWKNQLKGKAQMLFPDLKVTLKTADALLILNHGCRHPVI